MICFSDPEISAAFYRNQDLSWEEMVLPLIVRAFSVPAHCLGYIRASFMDPLFALYFTSSEGAADLTHRFARALESELKALLKERRDPENDLDMSVHGALEEETVDLFEWGRRVIYCAGMGTLFGPSFPSRESESLFWKVDEEIFKLFVGGKVFSRSEYNTSREYCRFIERHLGRGGAKESSEFVKHREDKHNEAGLSFEDRARLHSVTVWGLQANAPLAAVWASVHACHSPSLLTALRAEIATAFLSNNGRLPSFELLQTFDLQRLVELPLLNSLISETLRIYLTAGSIRHCTRDTSITHPVTREEFRIREGAWAQLVLQHVNHSPNVHENEAVFDAYRFFDKEAGVLDTKSRAYRNLRPFGGGRGLCPGRIVARNWIAVFVATIIWYFDIKAADEDQEIPGVLGVTKQGIQPPNGKYVVRFTVGP